MLNKNETILKNINDKLQMFFGRVWSDIIYNC